MLARKTSQLELEFMSKVSFDVWSQTLTHIIYSQGCQVRGFPEKLGLFWIVVAVSFYRGHISPAVIFKWNEVTYEDRLYDYYYTVFFKEEINYS